LTQPRSTLLLPLALETTRDGAPPHPQPAQSPPFRHRRNRHVDVVATIVAAVVFPLPPPPPTTTSTLADARTRTRTHTSQPSCTHIHNCRPLPDRHAWLDELYLRERSRVASLVLAIHEAFAAEARRLQFETTEFDERVTIAEAMREQVGRCVYVACVSERASE
jgi:hypothetical protein